MIRCLAGLLVSWLLACWVFVFPARANGSEAGKLDRDEAIELCRQYLDAGDDDVRARLMTRIASYTGDFRPVIAALGQRTYRPIPPGYYAERRFRSPELREKYPHDLLCFVVPKNYQPDRPTGLIIFLHGGGLNTSRDAPEYTLLAPDDDSPSDTSRSGDMLAATGMITVGPSAPGKGESYYRWCLRSSEEYLADVIVDCKSRLNIDPDRVFLLGHSMGGFGAYHHALRQPDRFAAILISAGSWDRGFWPVIRGTPLCIVQGVHDAQRGVRWHHTDVEYARRTHEIFTREKLDHVYYEHDGEHDIAQDRPKLAEYFAASKTLRRDPYYPHVTLASPQGFSWDYLNPVRHNRWLTLDETVTGTLTVDELISHGDDFDQWRLEHRRANRRGAMIDAVNQGRNRIEVTTKNVARFTVWLHPNMIDVSKPVTIAVDGKVRFSSDVRPSLATAIESYERRHDWGMIYPVKIELNAQP